MDQKTRMLSNDSVNINLIPPHEITSSIQNMLTAQKKYDQLRQLCSDAVITWDRNGKILDANEAFLSLSGYSTEEILRLSIWDVAFFEDPILRKKTIYELLQKGAITNCKITISKKTLERIPVWVSARRIIVHDVLCYMAIGRTDQSGFVLMPQNRDQRQTLHHNTDLLLAAANLAQLAPWEYDVKNKTFIFGDEFYALYGTNKENETPIMSFEDYMSAFVHPEDRWMANREKELLLNGYMTTPEDVKHRIVRRDNEVRTILVRRRVVKDIEGHVVRAYGVNLDITEREKTDQERVRQEAVILNMAYFDPLTGLANRRSLYKYLSQTLSSNEHTNGAIVYMDLDNIKMINDTYGHTIGDGVVVSVARRLENMFGKRFFVSRVGGDEFIVVLPSIHSESDIDALARKVLLTVSKQQKHMNVTFSLTASVGIARYPEDGDNIEDLLKHADAAMYSAKAAGRNSWRFFSEEMQQKINEKAKLVEGLRRALVAKELYLVYQPQYSVKTNHIIGFEALLRWKHERYGDIPPMKFIPMAEQAGFIHAIGSWVLREACCFICHLTENGWDNICVSVNVSVRQIAVVDFVDSVQSIVRETGVLPTQLGLEITESVFITSFEDVLVKLNALRQWGIHLSLDDFGTGFSSLTYLQKLPFETLKIDKSFVDMIENDSASRKMVGSIIRIAQDCKMQIVAEGVETDKQLNYLRECGCDHVQGYLLGKPMEADKALAML